MVQSFLLNQDQSINNAGLLSMGYGYSHYALSESIGKSILITDIYGIRDAHRIRTSEQFGIHPSFGYLFTGDLLLRKSNTYQMFYRHYRRNAFFIKLLYVPHHGARSGWNSDLLNDFEHPFCIVTAGEDNVHGHPHFGTTSQLDNETTWVVVNEHNGFNHGHILHF